MSEETRNETIDAIEDSGVGTFVSSLASVVNETYSYNNSSSLFCSLVPTFMKDYAWRYVRPACQWMDGYVASIHGSNSGIPSTRLATKLIAGLGKQVCGEKLIFKLADQTDKDESTLKFVSKWAEEQNIMKAIYNAECYSMGVGTALLKVNVKFTKTNNGVKPDLWLEAKRFDQCYYLANNQDEVYDAVFYIRSYTDTRENKEGKKNQYMVVEHRYFEIYDKPVIKGSITDENAIIHKKNDRVPMVCYEIYRTQGTVLNNQMPLYRASPCNWEEISKDVREMIKNDYAILRFGEPQALPFTDLGVQVITYSHSDISVPSLQGCGESMIIGIQDDLITYEYANACQLRDMYLGKGQVYLPKNLSMGDFSGANEVRYGTGVKQSPLSAMGNNDQGAISIMRGVDPEQQKAIVQQFDLRIDQWQLAKDNALRDIAVKWGMSAKILASYLAQGQAQQTATQVDSEDDMSIAFINLARSYILPKVNKVMETVLGYYGKVNNVSVQFASPSLVNKDRLLERIEKQLDMGLIDIEEAIRTYYSDAPEDEIQRKIEIATIQRNKMEQQQQAEFNSFGEYDEEDDLNGTTEPLQN